MNKTRLTPHEVRVAECVAEGKSIKETADILGIAFATIDGHLKHIRSKYDREGRDSRSMVKLVRCLIEDGIVPPVLPLLKPEPVKDMRPHSRACKFYRHPHGVECNPNCPSCHGWNQE